MDPEIHAIIKEEEQRQIRGLELIASEVRIFAISRLSRYPSYAGVTSFMHAFSKAIVATDGLLTTVLRVARRRITTYHPTSGTGYSVAKIAPSGIISSPSKTLNTVEQVASAITTSHFERSYRL